MVPRKHSKQCESVSEFGQFITTTVFEIDPEASHAEPLQNKSFILIKNILMIPFS